MPAPTPTAPTLEELLERISIALSPPHLGWYALLVDCQAAIRRLRDEKRAAGQADLAALRAENERLRSRLRRLIALWDEFGNDAAVLEEAFDAARAWEQ